MFRKTKTPETNLFESPSNLLRGHALKKYDDPKAWQNQFCELVTRNIDEDVFKPLFKDGNMDRSNASISQLVAIMVMKEGSRSSDEQMFEAVDYDLLVRKALGLVNLSDQAPSLDTYYLLRRRMASYEDETGINLIKEWSSLILSVLTILGGLWGYFKHDKKLKSQEKHNKTSV